MTGHVYRSVAGRLIWGILILNVLMSAVAASAQGPTPLYLPWVSRHAGPSGDDTALAVAARSLAPGAWAQIDATGVTATFAGAHGASGNVIPYSEDMIWDSTARLAYFLGGDHVYAAGDDFPRFVRYTDDTNTWEILPAPDWLPSSTSHGYDHSALDPETGVFYHRAFNSNLLRRYDPTTGEWSTVTAPFVNDYGPCCDALEYFPALGGVIWVRGWGEIWRYSEASREWDRLAESLDIGGTWLFAAFNPIRNEMVIGSAAHKKLYRLSATGIVTPLKDLPIQIYDGSGYNGDFTVDPVSGEYIALTSPEHDVYSYDSTTDAWAAHPAAANPVLNGKSVIAAPLDTYGVIGAVACRSQDCSMWIYKHAP